MKNVFFIVVDSFIASKLGDSRNSSSPTPFLDELKKRSLYCANMYSQGPYTEAGSRALLTGFDSLDNGGYMHNLYESPTTYLSVFRKAEYNIVDFFLPYYMYSAKEFECIDQAYFTSDFSYDSVWTYRLQHFADLLKQRPLANDEWRDVETQIDLTFKAWFNIFDRNTRGDYVPFCCLKEVVKSYDWDSNLKLLKQEYEEFSSNKPQYLERILKDGKNSNLFKIKRFDFCKMINQSFVNKNVFEKHKLFFKKLRKKQFLFNIKNQTFVWGKFVKSVISSIFNYRLDGWVRQYIYSLTCSEMAKGYTQERFYQTLPSMRMILRTAMKYIHENKGLQPILLHCHPEELHNRVNYFSFDINDEELLDHEFKLFDDYIGSLQPLYKGNILYDCSLIYVDDCLRELYDFLKAEGILNNSIIVICADHGSSYSCETIRDNVSNNCHTENYHIPLIIYDGSSQEGFENNKYHTSKDILATIYSKCGIEKPSAVTGEPITKESGSDFAISEYMGGGCPDFRERPILFIGRDSYYLVYYSVSAFEDFRKGQLLEVYNLRKDPQELDNIKDSVDKSQILEILEGMKKRHDSIANSYFQMHPDFTNSRI